MFYCRGARPEDYPEIYNTIQNAFSTSSQNGILRAFTQFLMKPSDCRIIVLNKDNKEEILGACPVFRHFANYGQQLLLIGGIFWFGIRKDYHRKGLGLQLLKDCNAYMTQEGFDANFLFTGTMDFYRNAGYEIGVLTPGYLLPLDRISKWPKEDFSPYHIRKFDQEDLPMIAEIYQDASKIFPLSHKRTLAYWKRLYELHQARFDHNFYVLCIEQTIIGFFFVDIESDRLSFLEFLIDPKRFSQNESQIVACIMFFLQNFVSSYQKQEQKRIYYVNFNCFPIHPFVKWVVNWGAHENFGLFSSLMGRLFSIEQFLPKFQTFQKEWLMKSWQKLLPFCPFNLGFQIEKNILQFKGDNLEDSVKLHIELNPMVKPSHIIPISPIQFCQIALLNWVPSDLADSEQWSVPAEMLPLVDTLFPPIFSAIFPLDKF